MASLVSWLSYSGARASDGTAVASGTAYFYQPGTTNTQVVVYSDADGLLAITQPVSLDAGGRAEVYTTAPVRVVVLSSAGATVRLEDRANTVAAAQVEVEQAGFTGTDLVTGSQVDGGRTDLETVLSNADTSFGPNFKYSESSTATPRNYADAVGLWVTPQDFGALGDGTTDDTTAFQAAIARAMGSNKGLFIPPGTYRITTGLTVTGATGTGLVIQGANRATCIIKNYHTSAACLEIDLSSAIESYVVLANFQVTASTTSSGAAIKLTNGDGVTVEDVTVGLHREGFNCTAVSYTRLVGCVVLSADSNASAKGFRLGVHTTALHCRTVNSTLAWGFSLEGANTNVAYCKSLASSAKGFDISASNCSVSFCHAAGATTGYVVGAIASASVVQNTASGCTTDVSTNASSTLLREDNPNFSTFSYATATTTWPYKWRPRTNDMTSVNLTDTFVPSVGAGKHIQVLHTANTSATAYTISAPSDVTSLVVGDIIMFVLYKTGANDMTLTWNATYRDIDGSALTLAALFTISSQTMKSITFRYDGTNFLMVANTTGSTTSI